MNGQLILNGTQPTESVWQWSLSTSSQLLHKLLKRCVGMAMQSLQRLTNLNNMQICSQGPQNSLSVFWCTFSRSKTGFWVVCVYQGQSNVSRRVACSKWCIFRAMSHQKNGENWWTHPQGHPSNNPIIFLHKLSHLWKQEDPYGKLHRVSCCYKICLPFEIPGSISKGPVSKVSNIYHIIYWRNDFTFFFGLVYEPSNPNLYQSVCLSIYFNFFIWLVFTCISVKWYYSGN